jgi:predicted ATP-dependent serine protease
MGATKLPQRAQERLKEAAKPGFTQAIVPAANQPKQKIAGMEMAGRGNSVIQGNLSMCGGCATNEKSKSWFLS